MPDKTSVTLGITQQQADRILAKRVSLKATPDMIQVGPDEFEPVGNLLEPPDTFEFLDIDLAGGVENYIERIRSTIVRVNEHTRDMLYCEYAKCANSARYLQKNDDKWIEFCQHKIWDDYSTVRPKIEEKSEALRFVLMRTATGFGRTGSQKASKIYCALNPLLESGIDPDRLVAELKNGGGVAKLARAHAKSRKQTPIAPTASPSKKRRQKPRKLKQALLTGSASLKALSFAAETRLKLFIKINEAVNGTPTWNIEKVEEV